jgi:hypothetical protein
MTIDDDMMRGIAMIAAAIGTTERQAYYLAETKQIPAFKMGGRYHPLISVRAEAASAHPSTRKSEYEYPPAHTDV